VSSRTLRKWFLLLVTAGSVGCARDARETLVVFNAGSLARPLRVALDSFALREGVRIAQESAGSLETARKLTELGSIPDVIALADVEVFSRYLIPEHVEGFTPFARNRMVVGFTERSRYASEITTANWTDVLSRPDVDVGRSDPDLDPNGYRTLLVWQLAARVRGDTGLPARLLARAPARNVRPKEADLVGLLEAGEFDYIWSYESMVRALGLRWIALGDSVDLSQPALADVYAAASVPVRGARPAVRETFRGDPIVYGYAIPRAAPNAALARRFIAFLESPAGHAILEREGLDVMEPSERSP
jgi:molybdate/tungstate transport system substrate-binding protein